MILISLMLMQEVILALFSTVHHKSMCNTKFFGSPDDWECFLHYLGCLLEDAGSLCVGTKNDSTYPLKSMDSHVSHLTDEAVIADIPSNL